MLAQVSEIRPLYVGCDPAEWLLLDALGEACLENSTAPSFPSGLVQGQTSHLQSISS